MSDEHGALATRKKLFEPLKVTAWDQKERFTGERKYVICNNCAALEQKSLQRGLIKRIAPRDDTWVFSRKDAKKKLAIDLIYMEQNISSMECNT